MNTQLETLPTIAWGSGDKTLVFLHYFSGAASSWQWVAEALSDNYRCLAINLPGFGGAPPLAKPSIQGYAAAIKASLDALEIHTYTLIGHSMGGKIALQLAADNADNTDHTIQQVILIAPSPATQEPMPDEEKQRLLNHHPSEGNAKTTVENAAQKSLTEAQRAIAIQTHTTADDSAWRWWLKTGMNHSIADRVKKIKIPVTVVASKDDPVIPYDLIQSDVVDLLSKAELITCSGVGHLMPLEDPAYVAQQIRQALTQSADS